MDKHENVILNGVFYTKSDLETVSDKELLELIYWVFDTYAGPDYAKIDLIKTVLRMADTTQNVS